jgi:hypothetical protein
MWLSEGLRPRRTLGSLSLFDTFRNLDIAFPDPSQKQEARRRRKNEESVAVLARSFGVSSAAIYRTTA